MCVEAAHGDDSGGWEVGGGWCGVGLQLSSRVAHGKEP